MRTRLLDTILFLLLIAFGYFFFDLIRDNNLLAEKLNSQEAQAKVLIDEIGQTKEENNMLFQKMLSEEQAQMQATPIPNSKFPILNSQSAAPNPRPTTHNPQLKTYNFLIIGHHQNLADTIILAVVNRTKQKITAISIPRDLFVKGRRINEYLSLYGISALKEKVSMVTGLPIHAYAAFDFAAFEELIDAFGGIDVYVSRAIYDPLFPDDRGNYTLYQIGVGSHHLNGKEALKYSRSRHSTSDFDRAKRQQQIIDALWQRVINFDFIKNLDRIHELFNSLNASLRPSRSEAKPLMPSRGWATLETDISLVDAIRYAQEFREFSINKGGVLSTENFLYSTINPAGQYILMPKGGFEKVREYVMEMLE